MLPSKMSGQEKESEGICLISLENNNDKIFTISEQQGE